MKTRPIDYLNKQTLKPAFGFQVWHQGRWMSVAEGGKPCIYDNAAQRDKKRAEYRKRKVEHAA